MWIFLLIHALAANATLRIPTGSRLIIKNNMEVARGRADVTLNENSHILNYCYLRTILNLIPARMELEVDGVINQSDEAIVMVHSADGHHLNLTCIVLGDVDQDDVQEALAPSLDLIFPSRP